MRTSKDFFNMPIGRLITNRCAADYGKQSTGCYAEVESVVGEVASLTDELTLGVTYTGDPGDYPDDFFVYGLLEFTGGILAGTRRLSIFSWAATGALVLREPLPAFPAVSDPVAIYRGCPGTREACKARGQILNARAFFEVPSSDAVLKFQAFGGE
jgi:hypothetical protein